MSKDYVLGNDQEELQRLKLQHDLWQPDLMALWDRSHLRTTKKVLDLGCGPGYTTQELIKYISKNGTVTAVDISENFLKYLNHTAKSMDLNITTQLSQIESLNLIEKDFDAAFCRWLMIFVSQPEIAIQKIRDHLKPHAQFVIQEYISYDSMNLVPDYPSMKPVVEAIFKSWKDQGGDPNRGQILPQLLEKNGFRVLEIKSVSKLIQPSEPFWQWPTTFYKNFLPRLMANKYLSEIQVENFFKDWAIAEKTPGSFFVAPTVIDIIAEKR